MTRVLAAAAAALAAASLAITLTRTGPAGVTSCQRIAYDYVAQVAQAQGLKITYYKLRACRQIDATHAVARAEVNVSYYGLVQDVVLVFHLTKSPWQISDVHPVG